MCFDNPKEALELTKKYNTTSKFDKRIVDNFENIYTTILEKLTQKKCRWNIKFCRISITIY